MSLAEFKLGKKVIQKITENHSVGSDSFSRSHRVFQITLSDLLKSKNLSHKRLISVRTFGPNNNGEKGIHELRTQDLEGDVNYSAFLSGDLVKHHHDTLAKYDRNEKPSILQNFHGFEHHLVRIFELKVRAIWLVSPKKDKEFYFPLAPLFHGLEKRLYTEDEFTKVLLTTAETLFPNYNENTDASDMSGG